jgi:hypothetical protein
LEARELVKAFKSVRFEWVPRERFEEADALSRLAYEEYRREHGLEPKYHKGQGLNTVKGNIGAEREFRAKYMEMLKRGRRLKERG